ncbi:hypothetical protein SAMN05216522_102268 [Rosenbergiella nectarea]|uniref:Uncharacterized protein n=1 Tax=Rosenbergiella nectarea TaxID=988801 RepID=A0A1H9FCT3_9GAMM|nr:hypothetical protein [Rosenbergiella nectarea]SEQ35746.1 hypothetical protein SAMN05216522_102268 [Rosenbergiella nectarea]
MNIIHCKNDKRLALKKTFRILDEEYYKSLNIDDLTIVTFSKIQSVNPTKSIIINGVERLKKIESGNVFLHNIQCESPFYAQILWDVSHQLRVGCYLFIEEELEVEQFLDKDYYRESFELVETINSKIYKYKKIAPLLIEQDKGLDCWSFCIPVGSGDPIFLNRCVERIREIEVPKKEIILCGKPHPDFKYFQDVKVIDDGSDGKINHLTKKKNILVENAHFANICILHDRVLLPINFYSAVLAFGDDYPITGFQSFYFQDKYNLLPRKYSDFNTIAQDLTQEIDINNVEKKDTKLISKFFYCYQHPARSRFGHDYLTGSLYLTKKNLWMKYPQNERLFWDDYEDIEYGIRMSSYGVPCRVNPHAITQSMNSRSVIHYYGYVATNNVRGKVTMSRCMLEHLPFIRRKPLFRISKEEARQRIYTFARKYGASKQTLLQVSCSTMSGLTRYLIIKKVIGDITVKLDLIDSFMADFSYYILCESMAPNEYEDIIRIMFSSASPKAKKKILVMSFILNNQLFHSFSTSPFYKKNDDWFIEKCFWSTFGNLISAVNLKYFIPGVYFPQSLKKVYQCLKDTTLWKA